MSHFHAANVALLPELLVLREGMEFIHSDRSYEFARSLVSQALRKPLSEKQAAWVPKLVERVQRDIPVAIFTHVTHLLER